MVFLKLLVTKLDLSKLVETSIHALFHSKLQLLRLIALPSVAYVHHDSP